MMWRSSGIFFRSLKIFGSWKRVSQTKRPFHAPHPKPVAETHNRSSSPRKSSNKRKDCGGLTRTSVKIAQLKEMKTDVNSREKRKGVEFQSSPVVRSLKTE